MQCDHTRPYTTQIWYNPCIIRQYIHSKTAEIHVLFSKSIADAFEKAIQILKVGIIVEYVGITCKN